MANKRARRLLRPWSGVLAIVWLAAALAVPRPPAVLAGTTTLPWSTPTTVADQMTHAARPALAYTADGVAHAVWESNGAVLYASRRAGEGWTQPQRLAAGVAPALAVDAQGELHVMFSNQFFGDFEIYHIHTDKGEWTLPVKVSRTLGYSAQPSLTVAPDGTLHAAWMDNAPGYWVIYYGALLGDFWTSQPVPNARGQAPTIAAAPNGTIYLAWQDRVVTDSEPGTYEILLSEMSDKQWSLPINISDVPQIDSLGAHLAMTADGLAHLTWVDQGRRVRYGYGEGGYWALPQTVWQTASSVRGPRILTEQGSLLHIAWDEGQILRVTTAVAGASTWSKGELIPATAGSLKDVTLTLLPAGGMAVGWVQATGPNNYGVYESQQASAFVWRAWLPTLWVR
ncbi:MAG: hypothetical protein AUK03_11235 [Anaerolineae bacterium CG2_30_64_16]|nr:MAG: hypothetical protein AUK03_11235 [Anaerolineae bacterium CG2_30_64_16]